jgi:hypothetical protein
MTWRLELEAPKLTLAESQLALAALGALRAGNRDAIKTLQRLLRRVRPTLLPGSAFSYSEPLRSRVK